MGPEARGLRIENLRKKIAESQSECDALTIRSGSPWLTPEGKDQLTHLHAQAVEHHQSLLYLLNLYERRG